MPLGIRSFSSDKRDIITDLFEERLIILYPQDDTLLLSFEYKNWAGVNNDLSRVLRIRLIAPLEPFSQSLRMDTLEVRREIRAL